MQWSILKLRSFIVEKLLRPIVVILEIIQSSLEDGAVSFSEWSYGILCLILARLVSANHRNVLESSTSITKISVERVVWQFISYRYSQIGSPSSLPLCLQFITSLLVSCEFYILIVLLFVVNKYATSNRCNSILIAIVELSKIEEFIYDNNQTILNSFNVSKILRQKRRTKNLFTINIKQPPIISAIYDKLQRTPNFLNLLKT